MKTTNIVFQIVLWNVSIDIAVMHCAAIPWICVLLKTVDSLENL